MTIEDTDRCLIIVDSKGHECKVSKGTLVKANNRTGIWEILKVHENGCVDIKNTIFSYTLDWYTMSWSTVTVLGTISRTPAQCDCGAVKARTTHSHWCTVNSVGGQI